MNVIEVVAAWVVLAPMVGVGVGVFIRVGSRLPGADQAARVPSSEPQVAAPELTAAGLRSR